MVYICLQPSQSKKNIDPHDNQQVTNQLNFISNIVSPISVDWEKPQAFGEEATAYEIPHPPLISLPNEICILKILDDEEGFREMNPVLNYHSSHAS